MAAISNAPSKILEVPREIRDIIYGNFIKNHHESVVVSRERGFTIDTPHMANLHLNKWCRNTSLMFVNHQIKEEYEDAVYRETAYLIHKPVAEWFFMEAKWYFWPVLQLDTVPDYVKSRLRRLELHLSISEKMMQKRTILTRTRTDMDAQMIYVIEECISRLPALELLTVLVDYCEDGVSRMPRHLHCGFSESRFLEYTPPINTSLRIYKAAFHRDFPHYWQHSGKVSMKDSTGTFHVKEQSAFDRQFLSWYEAWFKTRENSKRVPQYRWQRDFFIRVYQAWEKAGKPDTPLYTESLITLWATYEAQNWSKPL